MNINPVSSVCKFSNLMGKRRLSLSAKSFEADVHRYLRNTFERIIFLVKQAMHEGVFNHELLESFRHVPVGIWKKHYSFQEIPEKHHSISASVIAAFAADSALQDLNYSPWLDDALMQQSLIAELQKIGREFREFRAGTLKIERSLSETELDELYHALKMLKEFLNQSRSIEREQYRKDNEQLQLQVCIDEFLSVHTLGTARAQYELSFKRLVRLFGPKFLVPEFSTSQADIFINHLKSTSNGRPRWIPNGTDEDLICTLKPKTINKFISNCHFFFAWLIKRERYQLNNPFGLAALPKASSYSLTRRSYVADEIAKIVNYQPSDPREAKYFRLAAKWVPLLCLYTGMRPIEIVSLRVIQIRNRRGIDFISLIDQRGKSINSRRFIPIHSKLKAMGFLEHVNLMRTRGETVVFPELYPKNDFQERAKALDTISKWFNRTAMVKMGFDKSAELKFSTLLDLYCCRHTVISMFKEKGANGYIVKSLLGHYPDDEVTWGIYGGRVCISLEALRDTIELLEYGSGT
ncbi:hypothetical protein [Rheinheimera soli]|uniref:hypothetical protein n=1 Tax=Rheinheimera soli TaxID=443616 RepID=UPI001E63C8A5|nr:hypothetical protein [Rheinheimera soli]